MPVVPAVRQDREIRVTVRARAGLCKGQVRNQKKERLTECITLVPRPRECNQRGWAVVSGLRKERMV